MPNVNGRQFSYDNEGIEQAEVFQNLESVASMVNNIGLPDEVVNKVIENLNTIMDMLEDEMKKAPDAPDPVEPSIRLRPKAVESNTDDTGMQNLS